MRLFLSPRLAPARRARVLRARLARRARFAIAEECGATLVMGLGILSVMTISLTSVLAFTASGARTANRSNGEQTAYALAEAGINDALAVLAAPGTIPSNPSMLPARTVAYPAGTAKTATWSGAMSGASPNWVWTLTSVGSAPSAAGGSESAVTRKLSVKVNVHSAFGPDGTNFVYSAGPVKINGTAAIQEPIFTPSDLQLVGGAQLELTGSGSSIGGNLTGTGTVGLPTSGPPAMQLLTSISSGQSAPFTLSVNSVPNSFPSSGEIRIGGEVFAFSGVSGTQLSVTNRAFAGTTAAAHAAGEPVEGRLASLHLAGTSTGPSVNVIAQDNVLSTWTPPATPLLSEFANAAPGPKNPGTCVIGSGYVTLAFDSQPAASAAADHSLSAVTDLTPNKDYNCSATASGGGVGRIAWNHTTQLLTIQGNVFFDGDVKTSGDVRYDVTAGGATIGTITTTGSFTVGGNICGAGTASACDTTNWDPRLNQFTVVAGTCTTCGVSHDITNSGNGTMQGLFWTDGAFKSSGNGTVHGSLIAKTGATVSGVSGAPAPGYPSGPPGTAGGVLYAVALAPGGYGG